MGGGGVGGTKRIGDQGVKLGCGRYDDNDDDDGRASPLGFIFYIKWLGCPRVTLL